MRRQWWSEGKSLAHNSCLAPPEGHLCICQASARPPHYLCVTFCCLQGRGKTTAAFFFSPQGIVIVHYISRGERTFLLQKYKYSVSDNTETKCGLRVPAHPRRMSFSKSYPALLCRLIFYSLSTSFHWGRWDKEKLWGWSQHTSPSSLLNAEICSAPVPHFSYSVLQKNWDVTGWEGRWESKSKPASVWVMTDRLWAGGDEAGTKNDAHGEARGVKHWLTWKASWGSSLEIAGEHMCAHTCTHRYLSKPAAFSCPWVTVRNRIALWGELKGGCNCCSSWTLLKIHSRYCLHPWNRSSIHLHHFLTFTHTWKCVRSQEGTKNTLQRWSSKAEVVPTSILSIKSSLNWLPSTLLGAK